MQFEVHICSLALSNGMSAVFRTRGRISYSVACHRYTGIEHRTICTFWSGWMSPLPFSPRSCARADHSLAHIAIRYRRCNRGYHFILAQPQHSTYKYEDMKLGDPLRLNWIAVCGLIFQDRPWIKIILLFFFSSQCSLWAHIKCRFCLFERAFSSSGCNLCSVDFCPNGFFG